MFMGDVKKVFLKSVYHIIKEATFALPFIFLLCSLAIAATGAHKKLDPPRAGDPLPGLSANELAFFMAGKNNFMEVDSVQGTEPGAPGLGLGPRFNMNSCSSCHAQPAVGGSSPSVNPQIAMATDFGAKNTIPSFITLNGPVREARFVFQQVGPLKDSPPVRDGGVHDLYVITGRSDAVGCNIAQPDFATAIRNNNVIFRIPTPIFGGGLIQEIPDSIILANKNANLPRKKAVGIKGHENRIRIFGVENRSGNDSTISRFGWKAQNKSLMVFAGEAYNVEMGVSNELFQNERDESAGCLFNGIPEDHTHFDATLPTDVVSDVVGFTQFMRFLAPPQPLPPTPQTTHGAALFNSVGCSLCHTPSLTTGVSSSPALSNQPVNLYSDLLLHAMGPGLADNILQGQAGPDEFRTAPLWGLGQRFFFLHDGRTMDMMTAIQAHASINTNPKCRGNKNGTDDNGVACQSEANQVISNFNGLANNDQADLIAFLNSL